MNGPGARATRPRESGTPAGTSGTGWGGQYATDFRGPFSRLLVRRKLSQKETKEAKTSLASFPSIENTLRAFSRAIVRPANQLCTHAHFQSLKGRFHQTVF